MKRILVLAAALPAFAFASVNVNTAQQSELQRVKGLDKFSAKKIIEYRAQNGDFQTLDDLGRVLDSGTIDKVKPQLALAGDPFVPPTKPEKPAKKK
jgi:competence protein ComEA